jgi:hypothetical protein
MTWIAPEAIELVRRSTDGDGSFRFRNVCSRSDFAPAANAEGSVDNPRNEDAPPGDTSGE